MVTEARDEVIGQNMRRLRTAAGLSQAALAEALTGAGFPFSQQTILKIEKGTRGLKLTEAAAVAEILGTSVNLLLAYDEAAELEMRIHRLDRELLDRHVDLAVAMDKFLQALRIFKERVPDAGALAGRTLGANWVDMTEREVLDSLLDDEGFVRIDPGSEGRNG